LEAAPEPEKHLDSCDGSHYDTVEIKHLICTDYSNVKTDFIYMLLATAEIEEITVGSKHSYSVWGFMSFAYCTVTAWYLLHAVTQEHA
jgi:hypothetical protein